MCILYTDFKSVALVESFYLHNQSVVCKYNANHTHQIFAINLMLQEIEKCDFLATCVRMV